MPLVYSSKCNHVGSAGKVLIKPRVHILIGIPTLKFGDNVNKINNVMILFKVPHITLWFCTNSDKMATNQGRNMLQSANVEIKERCL